MQPSFRACIVTGALVASLCACSTGSSGGGAVAPPTPPPQVQSILATAQAPATVFLPSINTTIPPVATAGAQPGAFQLAASPFVTVPVGNPTASLAACGAPAPGSVPAGIPCQTFIAFTSTALAPASIPGFTNAIAYVSFASSVTVTLTAQPTIGFSLAPFPVGRGLRLYAFNAATSTWSDTGISPVLQSASISFPGPAVPLVLNPSPVAFALVAI